MEKPPFDVHNLPEPLQSMAQNFDPAVLTELIKKYDPATLSHLINTTFALLKNSLPSDQAEALKQMVDTINQMLAGQMQRK
ncbi:MAG: hypothetical protein ACOY81_04380 [Bacillota bacterium]